VNEISVELQLTGYKYFDINTGEKFVDLTQEAVIDKPKSGKTGKANDDKKQQTTAIIIIVVLGTLLLCGISCCIYCCVSSRRKPKAAKI